MPVWHRSPSGKPSSATPRRWRASCTRSQTICTELSRPSRRPSTTFKQWIEETRAPGEGSLSRLSSGLAAEAVALAPQPAEEARPAPQLPEEGDRRAGIDRRSGEDRRIFVAEGLAGRIIRSLERRESPERRSGLERRAARPA
jgi:hypothetical protein